jgi:hypothetical protein
MWRLWSLNPLFQKIETEDSKEYGILEKIRSLQVTKYIKEWILKTALNKY